MNDSTSVAERRALYNAVWRWHFYAGIFAIPFLLLLSVTGMLYLFHGEIEDWWYADRLFVAEPGNGVIPPTALIEHALERFGPAEVVAFTGPSAPERSASCTLTLPDGRLMEVYLNPRTSGVLGSIMEEDRLMPLLVSLHSLAYFGTLANRVIEGVAGWVLVLVVTGVYLWWPGRSIKQGFRVRAHAGQRVFWRDLHAVVGVATGAVIFFLALTGLPWTGFWGVEFASLLRATGQGMPAQVWVDTPRSNIPNSSANPESWTQSQSVAPVSGSSAAMTPIGVDRAIEIVEAQGIQPGYTMTLPVDASDVYTARRMPPRPDKQRVVYIDQYSGAVLADIPFHAYGSVAKVVEWGIAIHTGTAFGLLNKMVMLSGCLGIQFLCFSGMILWWKRRPRAGFSAPPIATPGAARVVAALTLRLSLLLPITALLLLLFVVVDRFALLGLRSVRTAE